MAATHKMLINGALVDAPTTFGVINPSTGEVFAQVPDVTREQTNEAVAAAKEAYKSWKNSSYEERKAVVDKLIEVTTANMADLCSCLVREQGKPMSGAQFEVGGCCAFLGGFSGLKVEDKVVVDNETEKVIEMHVPLGVVAGIVPWNFPLMMAVWKIGEALMTGNTIVIKSSPFTPLVTNLWGELVAAHIPNGVVNILSGGNDAGAWLVEHKDVAKISFTGSVATGKKIQAAAAGTLKRVTLELGGNDAAFVLDDAKPEEAAPAILQHAMANSGQVCIAVKRCYVPRSKYEIYIEEFKKAAATCKVGDGFEADVTMGPMNNKMQFDKVMDLINDAKANGAVVEAGGDALDQPGYFIPPTIFSNVSDGMRIVDEEQFGPVLPVIPYDDEEACLEMINSSLLGLGGSVWGEPEHAARIAAQVDSGTVWVNSHMTLSPDVSFGGRKESGIGRQMGSGTIAGYTDTKVIRMPK